MTRTLAVVMDPIQSIKPYKDTTLALMLAAQKRGWALRYLEMQDLWLRDGVAMARTRPVTGFDDTRRWRSRRRAPHERRAASRCHGQSASAHSIARTS